MKNLAKLTKKPIPRFHSEDAERRFWAEHDTTDYFDWTKAKRPRGSAFSFHVLRRSG